MQKHKTKIFATIDKMLEHIEKLTGCPVVLTRDASIGEFCFMTQFKFAYQGAGFASFFGKTAMQSAKAALDRAEMMAPLIPNLEPQGISI